MLSLVYLAVSFLAGALIAERLLSRAGEGEKGLNRLWIFLPVSFGAGVLVVTWCLYILAFLLHGRAGVSQPLGAANAVVLAGFVAFFLFFRCRRCRKRTEKEDSGIAGTGSLKEKKDDGPEHAAPRLVRCTGLIADRRRFMRECVFYGILFVFVLATEIYVFHVKDGMLCAGYTVFSDYAPHTAMIRSFSEGANYPTQYPHFGGSDVKYHFMFQFLAGNLEYLGLRIDWAYNLVSALSLTGFLMVLTQLAARLFRSFSAEILTVVFFFFRSGTAFFRFALEHMKSGDLASALKDNTTFIGYTQNENWGLWNYNVYLNQRHLGFGLLIAAAVIWFFFSYVERADSKNETTAETARDQLTGERTCDGRENLPETSPGKQTMHQSAAASAPQAGSMSRLTGLPWLLARFETRAAWRAAAPGPAALAGIILGLCGFWNGACVIGALLILFGMAIFSDHKEDYVIAALLAVALTWLQSKVFIRESAFSFSFYWGFIATDKSPAGVISYLFQTMGLTVVGAVALIFLVRKRLYRTALVCFLLPVVFALTVSLTPDVTVNEKYIMISMAFLAVMWAGVVADLAKTKNMRVPAGLVAAVLIIALTATGVYDFAIICRDNGDNRSLTVNLESDVTAFLTEHTTEKDLLLTPEYSMNEVTLSGRMLYLGWPYYAWSAGYDTDARLRKADIMYGTYDSAKLQETARQEGITYILYEDGMTLDGCEPHEDTIAKTFPLVYTSEDGRIRIYRTTESLRR